MPTRPAALAALLLLAPAAACACAIDPDAEIDSWSMLRGLDIRDIGGGRIEQSIQETRSRPEYCSDDYEHIEHLLFVDCTTGSAILIRGDGWRALSPDDANAANAPSVRLSVGALRSPRGPLTLTPATTVAEVAEIATREGYAVVSDVQAFAAEVDRYSSVDLFRGCLIFYPDSPGASR